MSRAEFDAGAVPRKDFIDNLRKDAKKYEAVGIREQVMLSFTTDPFNNFDMSLTRPTIEILQAHGLGVCTLTKGGARALHCLDLFRPERDAFASTLTSLDDSVSQEWEPNAAKPGDRITTLKRFHDAGIFTWVSLEPVYDTETALKIIERTAEFVDLYKIGRINYHRLTKLIDWRAFTHDVLELLDRLGKRAYIKKDLQPFLPDGFENPLRRIQANAVQALPARSVQEQPTLF
jgi:DNA repair photolyase